MNVATSLLYCSTISNKAVLSEFNLRRISLNVGDKRLFKDLKICLALQGKLERSMVLRVGCIKLQFSSASWGNLSWVFANMTLFNLIFIVLLLWRCYFTFKNCTPDLNMSIVKWRVLEHLWKYTIYLFKGLHDPHSLTHGFTLARSN